MAADGKPTTDPNEAIKGMLLPAAGPKGFGLAFVIDLLCGGLSGGAIGAEVRPLYGDPAEPYRCSQLFLAIDAGAFPDRRRASRSASAEQAAARQRLEACARRRARLRAGRACLRHAPTERRHLHARAGRRFDSLIAAAQEAGIVARPQSLALTKEKQHETANHHPRSCASRTAISRRRPRLRRPASWSSSPA